MKKFFSAILLIAAMAFSVSTFVSCNDLVQEVEDVTAQAGANAEAIKALQAQLESGLASANAAVEAAKTAAEKAVAEAKKAAIEEALAQAKELDAENTEAINALKAVVDALNGKITTLEGADAAIQLQIDALVKYLEFDGEKSAVVEDLLKKLADLQEQLDNSSVLSDIEKQFNAMKDQIDDKIAELSTLGNVVNALLKQIQSVTFVPSSSVDGPVNGIVNLGGVQLTAWNETTKKTSVEKNDDVKYLMATYEVRPAKAVEALEDANLKLVSVQTTKAVAPAEMFDVKVIDRDAETGRMLVVAYIPKNVDKAIYAAPAKYAFALVVTDEAEVEEDVMFGSNVSSEYVQVVGTEEAFEITKHVGWENENGVVGSYVNEVAVAFNTEIKDSERAMFDVTEKDLVVDFKGTVLTFEQVKEFFGIEVPTITYDALTKAYATGKSGSFVKFNAASGFEYDDNGKTGKDWKLVDSSIVMTDYKDFAAKAQMREVTTEDFEAIDAIQDSLVAKMVNFTVNGTNVGITATSTYKITYAPADVTIESPGKIEWNYKYAPEWVANYAYNQGGTGKGDFLSTMDELSVSGKATDMTVLKAESNKGDDVTPNGYLTMKGKAFYMNGKPYYKGTSTTQYEATIYIWIAGKQTVRLAGSPADKNGLYFAEEDLYWEFNGVAYDAAGTEYTIAFNTEEEQFVTEGVPAFKGIIKKDAEITVYPGIDNKTTAITPVADAATAHGIYDLSTAAKREVIYDDFAKEAAVAGNVVTKVYQVTKTGNVDVDALDDSGVDANPVDAEDFVLTLGNYRAEDKKNGITEGENSSLTIKSTLPVHYGEKYLVESTVKVFGITYTYEYTVTIAAPTVNFLEYNEAVTVDGNVSLKFDGSASNGYTIPAINLSSYYDSANEKLMNLLDGRLWNGTKYEAVTGLDDEFEIYFEGLDTYVVNQNAVDANSALTTPDPTVVAIKRPIATVHNGGTTAREGYEAAAGAEKGDVAWMTTGNFAYLNGVDKEDPDWKAGKYDGITVVAQRGSERILDMNVFKFRISLRTTANMVYDAAVKDYVPAVLAYKDVTITLKDYIEYTADTYKGPYQESKNDIATVITSQKILVTNDMKGESTNATTNVAKSLSIVPTKDYSDVSTAYAINYITGVEIVPDFVESINGEYYETATSGEYKKIDEDYIEGAKRYDKVQKPVFTYSQTGGDDTFTLESILKAGWTGAGWSGTGVDRSDVGLKFVDFDHTAMTVTSTVGTVRLVNSDNTTGSGVYVNAKLAEGDALTGDDKTKWVAKYTYNDPGADNATVTYDVATGQVTLNAKKLVKDQNMPTDIVVTVPVWIDYNYNPGVKKQSVKIVFTDEANKAGDAPAANFWDDIK